MGSRVRLLPPRHDGQNTCGFSETCQVLDAKINLLRKAETHLHSLPSRAHYGGRFAIATMRCAGSGGRIGSRRRAIPERTAKPRGPDPPTLGSSLVDDESMRRWWLKSPVHQG